MASITDLDRAHVGETKSRVVLDSMAPIPAKVRQIRRETNDVFTLTLEPPAGIIEAFNGGSANGFTFAPGQFNMLYLFGVGEVPISISGNPLNSKQIVHTIRATGTVTDRMKKIKRGDMLGVRGPFGSHWPVEASKGHDVVIVAGGIGLAPLRPAIYHILSQRELYGRVILLYGTRAPADILYARELERWRGGFDVEIQVTVDTAGSNWRGNVGVVTTLIPKISFDPYETIAMICGPEIMMRFTIKELVKYGLTYEKIYISMERNMKCAVGLCGHCQFGPKFVCKDGAVFRYDQIKPFFEGREI